MLRNKITDEEIQLAVNNRVNKDSVFTDDTVYDVIKDLTGISNIDEIPDDLLTKTKTIFSSTVSNVNSLKEADDELEDSYIQACLDKAKEKFGRELTDEEVRLIKTFAPIMKPT